MSYVSFIGAVSGLSITGVTRTYDHRPLTLNTADLPAQFIDLGGLSQNDDLTTCVDDGVTFTVDLIVALNPVGQDNADPNYTAQAAMVDNVMTALKGLGSSYFWSIKTGIEVIGEVPHWVVRAPVELRL